MAQEIPVAFSNCRNITSIEGGYLPIQKNRLNILFGRNGTGKTTISKVIECWNDPQSEEAISGLASFGHMISNDPSTEPSVVLPTKKATAFIFNNEWVENHCFQENGNLQSGAYELYVSSKKVKSLEKQRKQLLHSLKSALNDPETSEVSSLLKNASKNIGRTASGNAYQAFKDNSPLEGLPDFLLRFAKALKDNQKPLWMSWHVQGAEYAGNHQPLCPYCGSRFDRIGELISYDRLHAEKQGNAWGNVISVFSEGRVFRISINKKALRIMGGANALDKEDLDWLLEYAKRSNKLEKCIENLKSNIDSFFDGTCDGFFAKLEEHKETLEDMQGFSDEVRSVTKAIAKEIRRILRHEKRIRNVISDLEREAAAVADKYKIEIDELLDKCGYPYTIEMSNNCHERSTQVLLVPKSTGQALSGTTSPLSYGEQNTLALILFMFEAMTKPDSCVIVLDDPISSFDGDKRFALLYRMFHRFNTSQAGVTPKDSLHARTVIMLTHDYLVVSDAMTILRNKVSKTHALYLTCDQAGTLHHKEITRDDIRPYIQMIRKRINDQDGRNPFFKLVYTRCYSEMMRRKKDDRKTGAGCAFIVISLLVDGCTRTDVLSKYGWDCIGKAPYVINTGINFIKRFIPDFDFATTLDDLNDDGEIVALYEDPDITPFEKLQVLRLLIRQKKVHEDSPILVRYANEVYHLAGDYLLQLDPVDFNPVPHSVEEWCDAMFESFRNGLTP